MCGESLAFFTRSSVSAHQLFIGVEISGGAEEPAPAEIPGKEPIR